MDFRFLFLVFLLKGARLAVHGTTISADDGGAISEGSTMCVNLGEAGIPDIYDNCRTFLVCEEGTVQWSQCPPGTLFDYVTKQCDDEHDVTCPLSWEDAMRGTRLHPDSGTSLFLGDVRRSGDSESAPHLSGRPSATTSGLGRGHHDACSDREDGFYPDYSSYCRSFYSCSHRREHAKFACRMGQKFDLSRQTCLSENLVTCPAYGSNIGMETAGMNDADTLPLPGSAVEQELAPNGSDDTEEIDDDQTVANIALLLSLLDATQGPSPLSPGKRQVKFDPSSLFKRQVKFDSLIPKRTTEQKRQVKFGSFLPTVGVKRQIKFKRLSGGHEQDKRQIKFGSFLPLKRQVKFFLPNKRQIKFKRNFPEEHQNVFDAGRDLQDRQIKFDAERDLQGRQIKFVAERDLQDRQIKFSTERDLQDRQIKFDAERDLEDRQIKFDAERDLQDRQIKFHADRDLQDRQIKFDSERDIQDRQIKFETERDLQDRQIKFDAERDLQDRQIKFELERDLQDRQIKFDAERDLQDRQIKFDAERDLQDRQIKFDAERDIHDRQIKFDTERGLNLRKSNPSSHGSSSQRRTEGNVSVTESKTTSKESNSHLMAILSQILASQ